MEEEDKAFEEVIYKKMTIVKDILCEPTIINVQNDIRDKLEYKIKKDFEDKCIEEGYVKKNSVKLLDYGKFILDHDSLKGLYIIKIKFEALLCYPHIGMVLELKITDKIQFGLYIKKDPLIIHITTPDIEDYNVGDMVKIEVVNALLNLNKNHIYVQAKLFNEEEQESEYEEVIEKIEKKQPKRKKKEEEEEEEVQEEEETEGETEESEGEPTEEEEETEEEEV